MNRHRWTLSSIALAVLLVLAAGPAAAADGESYGYFRALDGSATVIEAGSGDRSPVEINQPVLAGDRVLVSGRSRVEIVLADRNILRLDGDTEVTLEQLAASPDRNDPTTVIRLHDGNILLTVAADSLGDQLPRVDTANAAIYPHDFGTYRITSSQGRLTEVTVRRGKAEVVTDRGTEMVQADQTAYVEGDRHAEIEVDSAQGYDTLERWASNLEDEARFARSNDQYVDDNLRYQAAPLARHGTWVSISGRSYWRPRVDVGWSPYSRGRWNYTPAGLTWISSEPWGWVPYHYGSWDYMPSHGWVWQAGHRWSPAWVYWYWGPDYVGWCPTGYYTSYYRNSYSSFRYGVYGWAGGSWDNWSRWTFVGSNYFRGYRDGYRNGYRDGRHDSWDVHRYAVPHDQLRRNGPLGRGVVTTDTRPLRPDTWDDPRHAMRVLTDKPVGRERVRDGRDARDGAPGSAPGELPDVTPFIGRKPLPSGLVRTVVADGDNDQTRGSAGGARPRGGDIGGGISRGNDGGGISSIPTDPSRDRQVSMPRVSRPRPADQSPTIGQGAGQGNPRQSVPSPRGSTPGVDRNGRGAEDGSTGAGEPRVGRTRPSEGGAPRPGSGGGMSSGVNPGSGSGSGNSGRTTGGAPRPSEGTRGTTTESPRVRVPRETTDSGSSRGSAGTPTTGGAPRPDRTRESTPPPSQGRDENRGGVSRPETPRSYTPPPSSTRDREQDRGRAGSSGSSSGSYGGSSGSSGGSTRRETPPPSQSRERYSPPSPPPSSSSRPEPAPSRPSQERARPSESRGDDSQSSSSRARPSEDRPPSSSRQSSGRESSSSGSSSSRTRERRPPQG